MSFPWSKKFVRVAQTPQPEVVQQVQVPVAPPPAPAPAPVEEVVQVVEIPEVDDKISVEEHKHGEQVVDARQEDNEDDEVEGELQEGGRVEEGDHGSEEELEEDGGR